MILTDVSVPPETSTSTASMRISEYERYLELFGSEELGVVGFVDQAIRVARGFARRKGRNRDLAYIDECIAEALYVITRMIWRALDKIKIEYPYREERFAFYRSSIGYRLKEYWAYRSTSTIAYLRKRGIIEEHETLKESHLTRRNLNLDMFILMESVCQDEVEKRVVELYKIGNTRENISEKLGITLNRVKKILSRVKKKLRLSK